MTKVTILGEEQPKEGKKIELLHLVLDDKSIRDYIFDASDWDEVVLLFNTPNSDCYDIMYCYNYGAPNNGAVVLGHFNSGTV